jgi:hypothetical protein
MKPGVYAVSVSVNGRTITAQVSLAAGETRVLWIADAGSVVRGASAAAGPVGAPGMYLNGKEINK